MLTSALTVIGVLVMMVLISPLLALVALLTIPTSIFLTKTIAKRSQPRFVAQWRHTGALNAQVEEAFTGHALVKAFGRQREVEQRFAEKNEELYPASFGAQFMSGIIQPTMMFLGNLNFVAIAVIGGLRVASGTMTIGDIQAFIQYSRQFTMPLTQVASMANILQSGIASAERVFEFLDAEEQSPDVPLDDREAATVTGRLSGKVEFDHVSFSYDPKNPLIQDLSLVAEPGRTVAIVGPTGAGKTTLVNLIMRFYELDDGRHPPRRPGHRPDDAATSCAARWAWCSRTPGCSAARSATTSPTATRTPPRSRSWRPPERPTSTASCTRSPTATTPSSTTRARSMSAGEKQLLTIARAFLADPTILILDEATSSVDTRTEVLIQQAMAALRTDRTSFVIAHRLSTIRDADVILVMDGGRIVEQGHHTELLARGGAYATLYQAQFAAPAADVA